MKKNTFIWVLLFISGWFIPTVSQASTDAPIMGTASAVKFIDGQTNYLGGVALDDQGFVWGWGYNTQGMVGANNQAGQRQFNAYAGGMVRLPFFIENNLHIVAIEAGYHTNYALSETGEVYAWGKGNEGQMGNGTTKADNPRPVLVSSLAGHKIVKLATSSEASSRTFALDDEGKLYGWGYGAENLIPGKAGYVSQAVELTEINEQVGRIVDVKIGTAHGLLLNEEGRVFVWGNGTSGQFGQGNLVSRPKITAVPFFDQPEHRVVQISAEGNTNLAITEDGQLYQWGAIYKTAAITNITRPELVAYDLATADYIPIPQQAIAGKLVNYFIDQHGRIWSWGYNTYYSFGTDGPLTGIDGKLNTYTSKARQQPKTMGDGDTQGGSGLVKAPVFKNKPSASFTAAKNSYKSQFGQWSSLADGLHPTIYDKKYMETVGEFGQNGEHTYVFPVDRSGRRLVYTIRQRATNSYDADFLVATDDYSGPWMQELGMNAKLPAGLTTEASSPMVKEAEKSWISLAVDVDHFDYTGNGLKEMPYITQVSTYQSSTVFLDGAGNMYRTGLDGSGAVAWGWDYSPYEKNTASNNATDGLFNMYTYEVMFMRGSPRVVSGSVAISEPKRKHYLSNHEADTVTIDLKLGNAYFDEQLNFTLEPELRQAKYVVLPYDEHDPFVKLTSPSLSDFEAVYGRSGYHSVDLAVQNGWQGQKQTVGGNQIVLTDQSLKIDKNAVVWVLLQTGVYSAESTVIKTLRYDNFYTDLSVKSAGINKADEQEYVYQPTEQGVAKLVAEGDDEKHKVGFPLDANGEIIKDASFGYDQVTVDRIPDQTLSTHNPSFPYLWQWYQPQTTHKVYRLTGEDKPANSLNELTKENGELAVSTEFTHRFYYQENPATTFTLHYRGVDEAGNILKETDFKVTEESLKKGREIERIPPDLIQSKSLRATSFKVMAGEPPVGKIDTSDFEPLLPKKEATEEVRVARFMIEPEQKLSAATLVYRYEKPRAAIKLHVRQVILNSSRYLPLPEEGYLQIKPATEDWQIAKPERLQARITSGKQSIDYQSIQLPIEPLSRQFLVEGIRPQYYRYLGYRLSSEGGDYPVTELKKEQSIQLDYRQSATDQWLTLYYEPTETRATNFSVQTVLNAFGKLKW